MGLDPITMIAGGMMALQGLSSFQTGQANKQLMDSQARQAQAANAANETIEGERTAEMLSTLRAAAFAGGTTLAGAPVVAAQDIQRKYLRDKSIRQYNVDVESEALRGQGRIAQLEGTAGLLGGLSGGLVTIGRYGMKPKGSK